MDSAHADWLAGLASHLMERQPAVLQAWRRAVDADPELTTPASLPRPQFNNHIPDILAALADRLRRFQRPDLPADDESDEADGESHGLQRWQQGYELREITREWGHLQRCLLDELKLYSSSCEQADPEALHTAYVVLVELCNEGVSDSTVQYFHLEQMEALGQVRDLSQTLEDLRELEQVRAELWRQAAHDLRGSVGAVTNATAGLTMDAVPEPTRERFFRLLQKSVSSVHSMLNDVISLARLQAGQEQRQLAEFDVAPVLRDMCESFLGVARERGLYLRAEGPERLEVVGDAIKLRRIAQNLTLNALRYTHKGGVTVSWCASRSNDSERWTLSVEDTGPGIHIGRGAPTAQALETATEQADQDDRTERSESAANQPAGAQSTSQRSDPQRGEGVGLSIVKRLCDLLDASVEVESVEHTGTVFRVLLPRRYPRETEASRPPQASD